jgi:lysophospholipase L1-like esterase
VAAGLAAAKGEAIQYANLAIRGRLLEPIVTEQLPTALTMKPTLLTLNGGGNDMLRPRTDVAQLMTLTSRAVSRCKAEDVRLVLLSGPDPSTRLPFGKTIRRRGEELTEGVKALAAQHDLLFVNCFHDTEIRRAHYWSADRLHLNAAGHQRVAGLVLEALEAGETPEPGHAPSRETRRLLTEARYYWDHVLPWVQRRLRRQSSGDARTGKHVEWTPVEPAGQPSA